MIQSASLKQPREELGQKYNIFHLTKLVSHYEFSLCQNGNLVRNLRNLRCLAVECDDRLQPGERTENKSVADSQVGDEVLG